MTEKFWYRKIQETEGEVLPSSSDFGVFTVLGIIVGVPEKKGNIFTMPKL